MSLGLRALVKITDSGDVVLAVLADNGTSVAKHHSSVVTGVTMNEIPLVHRGHNDHVVLAGLTRYEGAASARQISNFGKFVPGLY